MSKPTGKVTNQKHGIDTFTTNGMRVGPKSVPCPLRVRRSHMKEVETFDEAPISTPLDDEGYDVIFVAEPPEPLVPSVSAGPSSQESIVELSLIHI